MWEPVASKFDAFSSWGARGHMCGSVAEAPCLVLSRHSQPSDSQCACRSLMCMEGVHGDADVPLSQHLPNSSAEHTCSPLGPNSISWAATSLLLKGRDMERV